QSAGSLATTHEVMARVDRDLRTSGDHESLATVEHLFEAALYLGRLSVQVASDHRATLSAIGVDGTSTFILGGQIGDEPPDILLVYPEGNYIRASDDRPFLQIGESKYGKFMLDIAVIAHTDLVTSLKIALGSMMSTARANLSVGPPYDAAVYRNDAFDLDEHRFTAESPVLGELREVWERNILNAVGQLPDVGLSELRAADGRGPD
ncbi:MAG TPA: hypothetical protein VIV36_07795, partial [Gaiella sp.]